jgi:hypothetical protein
MKWLDVMNAAVATVVADPELALIYGEKIRMSAAKEFEVPALNFDLVADAEDEVFATVVLQFDQWCETLVDLAQSELRLRRLFHRDLPTDFGGLTMWAQYVDGEALSVPDRDGYFARAIRFRFTPLRDLYQPSPIP